MVFAFGSLLKHYLIIQENLDLILFSLSDSSAFPYEQSKVTYIDAGP